MKNLFLAVLLSVCAPMAALADTAVPPKAPIEEFSIPTPYSNPVDIAVDQKGRVWFASLMVHKIGVFDPATNSFSEYELPNDSSPSGICVDGSGVVWFTLSSKSANAIGSLTPDTGEITTHKIAREMAEPYRIAAAPDGAVWFTERNANLIGMFKDGKLQEYKIPTPNSQPVGIDVGKDGIVWFAESNGNKIGRIDVKAGKIAEYRLRTPLANPEDVAVDKDGNVWLVEKSSNRITMFNVKTNEFNEAILPTPASVPVEIAIAGNGIVWVSSNRANKIASLDPYTSIIKEYEIPTNRSLPMGIAVDNDGNVWFAEADRDANKIGRLTPPVAPSVQPAAPVQQQVVEVSDTVPAGSSGMGRVAAAIIFALLFAGGLWYILTGRSRR